MKFRFPLHRHSLWAERLVRIKRRFSASNGPNDFGAGAENIRYPGLKPEIWAPATLSWFKHILGAGISHNSKVCWSPYVFMQNHCIDLTLVGRPSTIFECYFRQTEPEARQRKWRNDQARYRPLLAQEIHFRYGEILSLWPALVWSWFAPWRPIWTLVEQLTSQFRWHLFECFECSFGDHVIDWQDVIGCVLDTVPKKHVAWDRRNYLFRFQTKTSVSRLPLFSLNFPLSNRDAPSIVVAVRVRRKSRRFHVFGSRV